MFSSSFFCILELGDATPPSPIVPPSREETNSCRVQHLFGAIRERSVHTIGTFMVLPGICGEGERTPEKSDRWSYLGRSGGTGGWSSLHSYQQLLRAKMVAFQRWLMREHLGVSTRELCWGRFITTTKLILQFLFQWYSADGFWPKN